jgi:hypothetical protein
VNHNESFTFSESRPEDSSSDDSGSVSQTSSVGFSQLDFPITLTRPTDEAY